MYSSCHSSSSSLSTAARKRSRSLLDLSTPRLMASFIVEHFFWSTKRSGALDDCWYYFPFHKELEGRLGPLNCNVTFHLPCSSFCLSHISSLITIAECCSSSSELYDLCILSEPARLQFIATEEHTFTTVAGYICLTQIVIRLVIIQFHGLAWVIFVYICLYE